MEMELSEQAYKPSEKIKKYELRKKKIEKIRNTANAVKNIDSEAEETYDRLLNSLQIAVEKGDKCIQMNYKPYTTLSREYNEDICKRVVEMAKADGFGANFIDYGGFYDMRIKVSLTPTHKKFFDYFTVELFWAISISVIIIFAVFLTYFITTSH